MRVLISGAAGLVGSAIARHTAASGHEVIRIWRATPPEPLPRALDVRCDLDDAASVAALPSDVDIVVHAAARIPAGDWSDSAAAETNRRTDDGLVSHFAGAGYSGAWVYISSIAVEPSRLRDGSRYAAEKGASERQAALAFPGRARSLRITSPYGPGMRHLNVLRRFIDAAQAGTEISLLGSGSRTQDFVHIDDVAAAALAAGTAPGGDPVAVGSGGAISMVDLAQLVVRICGSESTIVHSDRPDPQEDFRADYDLSPARDALEWSPSIPLETGLRSMMRAP